MEVNIPKTVKTNAKTLKIFLKVRDCFSCSILDEQDNEIKDYEGYVPSFMPGDHYGDYVDLEIDLDTGKITNFEVTPKEIENFILSEEE